MTVEVTITRTSAIYVNSHRITDRSTKPWGGSETVDTFRCAKSDVVKECLARGHRIAVRKIDEEPYILQRQLLECQKSIDEHSPATRKALAGQLRVG